MEYYNIIGRKHKDFTIIYECYNYKTVFINNQIINNFLNIDNSALQFSTAVSKDTILKLYSYNLPLDLIDTNQMKAPTSICVMVTDRCNLKCKYCYSLNCGSHTKFAQQMLLRINEADDVMSIMITGGEPLSWEGLTNFLLQLNRVNKHITIATNGTLLENVILAHPEFRELIQERSVILEISLDHCNPNINDCFRGSGEKVLVALNYLRSLDIPFRISTVLTRNNISKLDTFSSFLCQYPILNWTLLPVVSNTIMSCDSRYETKVIDGLVEKYTCLHISYSSKPKPAYSLFMIGANGDYILPGSFGIYDKKVVGSLESSKICDIWKKINQKVNIQRYTSLI